MESKEPDGDEIGCLLLIGSMLVVVGVLLGASISIDRIISKEPITPTMRYIVKDNKVDSLYIYEN